MSLRCSATTIDVDMAADVSIELEVVMQTSDYRIYIINASLLVADRYFTLTHKKK